MTLPLEDMLFPSAAEAIQNDATNKELTTAGPLVLPVSLPSLASRVHMIADGDAAQRLVSQLNSIPLSAMVIHVASIPTGRPKTLRNGRQWCDPTTLSSPAMSLAAWTASLEGGNIIKAVVDLREPSVLRRLETLLRTARVPLIFHDAKQSLRALWKLGLTPDLSLVYDTWVVARMVDMGRHHKRAVPRSVASVADQIRSEERVAEERAHAESLVGLCQRYGILSPPTDPGDELHDRLLSVKREDPLPTAVAARLAADAECVLRIYAAQQADIVRLGLAHHLYQIEFPFTVTNARIEWRGVPVSEERLELVRRAATTATAFHAEQLASYGIGTPGSADEFLAAIDRLGLGHLFDAKTSLGSWSTEDRILKALEGHHEVIRHFRLHRKYSRLAAEEWLSGALICADGRLHPEHRQLEAQTGRNSCTTPNIVGIGKVLRPVVVAPQGRALIELDYAQIEVGVAAAVHGDAKMIAAYNSADLYAFMARDFYSDQLTDSERALPLSDFRAKRPDLRQTMKVFVLSVLYNAQAPTVAARLKIGVAEAERLVARFLGMFPSVRDGLMDAASYGSVRGAAYTWTGLRRHVPEGGTARWHANFLRNTPIQGTAASIFKKAVVDLDREFAGTITWIILPVHDAVVIECQKEDVEEVSARAQSIMQSAVKAFFPVLNGKVDVNNSQPHCWNKDGVADSIEQFLRDPNFSL